METQSRAPAVTREFSLFLGDLDPELFFTQHWERRSLHLPHRDPQRFAHLISPESLFEIEVNRCGHLKASTRDRDGWNVEIPIQPAQAEKMFRSGMTICASMLDESGAIGELVAAYRHGILTAAPPHVNCYYSPDQQGYGLHFDTHPVWILQVAGSKVWTVGYEPAVRNPPFNLLFPPNRDRVRLPWIEMRRPDVTDRDHFMEVRLEPGDVLYIPAGGWHAARAEGSSLALTLALGRIHSFDLFHSVLIQAVQTHLRTVTERLSPFPRVGLVADDRQRSETLARLAADLGSLKDMVDRIQPEHLLELFEFLAEHPETLLANRSLTAASGQVEQMKAMSSQGLRSS
jgi:ribosomal protein L16 Arg81 hydroxylase